MKISKEEVKTTAELAKLEFTESELEKFTEQLGEILKHIEDLNELNTEKMEYSSHILSISAPLREDEVHQLITKEDALINAPESSNEFFVVPKVIEG